MNALPLKTPSGVWHLGLAGTNGVPVPLPWCPSWATFPSLCPLPLPGDAVSLQGPSSQGQGEQLDQDGRGEREESTVPRTSTAPAHVDAKAKVSPRCSNQGYLVRSLRGCRAPLRCLLYLLSGGSGCRWTLSRGRQGISDPKTHKQGPEVRGREAINSTIPAGKSDGFVVMLTLLG